MVKYFVEEKKVDVNLMRNEGGTALHDTAVMGHRDLVEHILINNSNIETEIEIDRYRNIYIYIDIYQRSIGLSNG